MNRTAAEKQALSEARLYRSAIGWVLATWREDVNAWDVSPEEPYSNARQMRSDWIKRRVEGLVGDETDGGKTS